MMVGHVVRATRGVGTNSTMSMMVVSGRNLVHISREVYGVQ